MCLVKVADLQLVKVADLQSILEIVESGQHARNGKLRAGNKAN